MKTKHVSADHGTLVVVPAGTLVQYEGVGIQINCNVNEPEFDEQPYVTVNTERMLPVHNDSNGCPRIAVHLNDAVLFDVGLDDVDDSDVMKKLRAAHEAAQGKGDQGAFDVWNVVAEILETSR